MDLSIQGPGYGLEEDRTTDRNQIAFANGELAFAALDAVHPRHYPTPQLPYNEALVGNPLQTSQLLDPFSTDAETGALDQSQDLFNEAPPMTVPFERPLPASVISGGGNALRSAIEGGLHMVGMVPYSDIQDNKQITSMPLPPTSTAPPTNQLKEEPTTIPAVETLSPRRPVRKYSLKRTFDIEELEAASSEEIKKSNHSGRKKIKEGQNSYSSDGAADFSAGAGASAGARRGRPPSKGRTFSGNTYQNVSTMTEHRQQGPPSESLPPRPSQEVAFPCPLDTPCPRKVRSELKTCPKTSRASISRLKQAAHGNLPLGGAKSLALTLLLGSAREMPDDLEEEKDEIYESEDSGNFTRRRRVRTTTKLQAQSGSRGDSADLYTMNTRIIHQQGPNAEQIRAMAEIAAAPPEMRPALLHKLMEEKLGVSLPSRPSGGAIGANGGGNRMNISSGQRQLMPNTVSPTANAAAPPLSALARSDQQLIVKQLMAQMTPQQKQTMLNLPTTHQAEVIQQFYQKYVVPKRMQLQQEQQKQQQQQQRPQQQPSNAFPMIPLSADATPLGGALKRENQPIRRAVPSNSVPPVSGTAFLRDLLLELGPDAEAQLAAMPREQQQKLLRELIQHRRQKLLVQQQQQMEIMQQASGFNGGGALPGNGFGQQQQRQQQQQQQHSQVVTLTHPRQQQQQQQQQQQNLNQMSNAATLNRSMNAPAFGLAAAAGGGGGGNLGFGGGAPVSGTGPIGGSGGGGLFAADISGLGGLDPDPDALQDAMNFFLV